MDALIVSTARTPLCKSWKGALNTTHGATMGGHVVKAALERAKLDPAEVEFTYDQASAFEDLESGEQIPVVPEALAEQYRALIREHSDTLRSKFSELRIDYQLINTATSLDQALFSYLSMREQLTRVR